MKHSALQHLNKRHSIRWSGAEGISNRNGSGHFRPRVSFAEFKAIPVGFVSIRDFVAKNFSDSDRSALSDIRKRRAQMTIETGKPKTLSVIRMERGLSQAQLAESIGTSQPSIARLEAGIEKPSFDKLVKLHEALKIEYDQLVKAIANAPDER